MATAMQKNVCATRRVRRGDRRRLEKQNGNPAENCPARSPCRKRQRPAIRIQRRFSTRQVQMAMDDGQQPRACRRPCDACARNARRRPSCGILYQDPNEVGQSGTESPASLLVTSAPAMIRRKVAQARTRRSVMGRDCRCAGIGFQSRPLGSGRHQRDALSERDRSRSRSSPHSANSCFIKPGIASPQTAAATRCGLEALIDGLGFFRGDGYLLVLLAQFFLDEGDSVVARRQALDLVLAVLSVTA